ncbi:Early nodulin-93 [Bienertia sinuspersici]
MGILSSIIDQNHRTKTSSFLIAAPLESKKSRDDCTLEGAKAGAKAATIAAVVTAVPTLVGCRVNPWAKANLNYTAQALIISAASIAAYFITADKTILECARRNAKYDRS